MPIFRDLSDGKSFKIAGISINLTAHLKATDNSNEPLEHNSIGLSHTRRVLVHLCAVLHASDQGYHGVYGDCVFHGEKKGQGGCLEGVGGRGGIDSIAEWKEGGLTLLNQD